jgi:hypothetical protein
MARYSFLKNFRVFNLLALRAAHADADAFGKILALL